MVARYFFDLMDGDETIHDSEGVEAADLDAVLAEARTVIAEMADEIEAADPGRSWALIVRDAAGSAVARVPIKR